MQLSGIFSADRSMAIHAISGNRYQTRHSVSAVDTVSISEEAIAAYKNSKSSSTSSLSKTSGNENEINERLTAFFNRYHSGTTSTEIQRSMNFNGELLPENKELKENIEAQVDKLIEEENCSPGKMPSPEFLEKFNVLYQKLNAIAALGSAMPITEDVLQQSASYLQCLEDKWSSGNNITFSNTILHLVSDTENSKFDILKEFFGKQES